MPTYRLPGEDPPAALVPKLIRDAAGDITLTIDGVGEGCDVATLKADGRLMLCNAVPRNLGLQVDRDGYIVTVKE